MKEYYCITQLTGRGYEILLDSVDSTVIAAFLNGTIVCVGTNPAMEGLVGQDQVPTKVAA